MNSKNALIVMTKKPVLGECKTRLAQTLGDQKALAIYIQLLNYTAKISKEADADLFVYSTDEITNKTPWESLKTHFKIQSNGDLGARMNNAIKEVFQQGYEKAIVIGSDCAEINSDDINYAFQRLNSKEIVLGPALDGGYYLIGIKTVKPTLFNNITWSTTYVLEETISKINSENLSYALLDIKSDIDVEEDLLRDGYVDFKL